jgi:tRNA (guanine37-N1)-methyltransferase
MQTWKSKMHRKINLMRFDVLTIFPGFFSGFLENGILRRALAEGLVTVNLHDLRAYTHDRHRTVDDRPFGGGEGMVLKPEPIAGALAALGIGAKGLASAGFKTKDEVPEGLKPIDSIGAIATTDVAPVQRLGKRLGQPEMAASGVRPTVILLSAQGRPFTQAVARELVRLERVVLICGRYEGVDERINELYCDRELSIGDYVISGGELAAAVVVDATMRLLPGVLGNEASGAFESFGAADAEIETDVEGVPRSQHGAGGLLDYPHYTRPADFAGVGVPEVLLNGDHAQIRRWRREQQLRKTLANRPDLLEHAALSAEDRKILDGG